MSTAARVHPDVLTLDWDEEIRFIAARFVDVVRTLRRRGAVVAVSGGIDSSVSLALAVRALGKDKVVALSLPERESSQASRALAAQLTRHLGVELITQDLTAALEGLGAYATRDAAIKKV